MKCNKSIIAFTLPAIPLLVALASSASAADQTYDDTSPSNAWDTSTSNWDSSTSTWTNGNSAIFAGTGETVTVDTVSAAGITINSSGYTLSGGSINSSGTIAANQSATINSNISLAANQSWSAAASTPLALGGVISGSNTLTYGGSGAYTISGINTNSGNLTIDAATVTVNSGATLFGSGLGWAGRTVTVQNGGILSATNYANGAGFFWGQIGDGANNIVLQSGGVFRMTGATMDSTVNKGISVAAGETGTFHVPTGNTATWAGSFSGRDFNSNAGSTFSFDIDGTFSTTRFLRGAGGFTKSGAGSLTLDQTHSFTGTLTIDEGTLVAAKTTTGGAASALGGGSTNIVVNANGTLVIDGNRGAGYHNGSATIHGGKITMNGGDLSFVNANTLTFDSAAGTIDGTGFWRRRESGNKVAVTAAASGSTISVTTLNLLDSSPTFEVADGANAADLTISSEINGAANLVKTGTGTLVISGVSTTYGGTTQVNAGTLQVDGTLSGNVTVATVGTLAGSGTLTGNTTLAGTLAPGNSPGTLSITGNLALDSAAILAFELDPANTTAGGGINDLVNIGGNLTLDGTLDITGLGSFSGVVFGTTWRLFDYSGTLTDNGPTLGSMPTLDSGLGWELDTATPNQVNLTVIPEPATAGLTLLALGASLFRRRR